MNESMKMQLDVVLCAGEQQDQASITRNVPGVLIPTAFTGNIPFLCLCSQLLIRSAADSHNLLTNLFSWL